MKKVLFKLGALVLLVLIWIAIFAYFGIWMKIFTLFSELLHSDDPLGWSGVVAMIAVLFVGGVIYSVVSYIFEKLRGR